MRRNILRQVFVAGVGHTGGALSMVEIIISIFDHFHEQHDDARLPRVVISKGHAAACLYAWLAEKGHIKHEELDQYRGLGGRTQAHVKPPTEKTPGLEGFYPSGSLTHGLSLASGIAIAELQDRPDNPEPVFCVLGDTEMQGGQLWEAATQISYHKLNHIVAIVDDNGLGNDCRTEDTMGVGDLRKHFEVCGWHAVEVSDGHDLALLNEALKTRSDQKPCAIIAKTIKGKGVSFMENDNIWHGRGPDKEQFMMAADEVAMDKEDVADAIRARDKRASDLPSLFPGERTLRDAPAEILIEEMKENDRIVVIAPELAESTRAARIKRAFPDRVYNFGVQEPNAMDAVAGLALSGKFPVILTFTNFVLLRTVEQIFQNIAPFGKNALIVGTHDGLLEDGMSVTPYNHFAIARSFYGSTVLAAADYYESKGLTKAALDRPGYSFLFNARENMPLVFDEETRFRVGVAKIYDPRHDRWTDRVEDKTWKKSISPVLNVAVAGAPFVWLAQQAIKELYQRDNVHIGLINMSSIKPLDVETLGEALKSGEKMLVVEKHTPHGGLYSAITEFAFNYDLRAAKISHFPNSEWVGQSGTPDQLISHYGFDKDSLKRLISTISR